MLIDVDLYDELDKIHFENEKRKKLNNNKINIFTKLFHIFCCCVRKNNNYYDIL